MHSIDKNFKYKDERGNNYGIKKKPLHSILPMKWYRQLFIVNAMAGRRIRSGVCFSLLVRKKLKRLP